MKNFNLAKAFKFAVKLAAILALASEIIKLACDKAEPYVNVLTAKKEVE